MSPVTPSQFWKNLRTWLPGLLVTILAVWLLSRLVTIDQLVSAMRLVDWRILPVVIGLYFAGMFSRCFAWQAILGKKVGYKRVFFGLNEGYLLNNVFPLRLGELGRAVLVGRSSGLGTLPVLSSIVIERSFDLAIGAGMLLAALPLALGMAWARPLAWTILGVVALGLACLYALARFRTQIQTWLERWGKNRGKLVQWALPKVGSLLEGFSALTSLRLFLLSLGWLLISWVFATGEDWVLLRSFVPSAPFWWGMFVIGVSSLGGALPSVSGAVGVLEAAIVAALVVLKVDPNLALAYGIILHLNHFIMSSLLGVIGLTRDGESLGGIFRELSQHRKAAGPDVSD